jgi:hypothetical protein
MSALAFGTFLLAEGASTEEKRQAIAIGVGAFLGFALLLFTVSRFNRDR